ncbi:cell wall synthase accessory phosphoprotein MacP, partial [Streptococcus pneumoniae]
DTLTIEVEPSIHKSRRIENTKRNVFNSKLNKILFAVIFLLILLILAMRFI